MPFIISRVFATVLEIQSVKKKDTVFSKLQHIKIATLASHKVRRVYNKSYGSQEDSWGSMETASRFKRKAPEKPPVRPKPAYLRNLFAGAGGVSRRVREGAWARRVRLALAADLLQGRCRAADTAITAINKHFVTVAANMQYKEHWIREFMPFRCLFTKQGVLTVTLNAYLPVFLLWFWQHDRCNNASAIHTIIHRTFA